MYYILEQLFTSGLTPSQNVDLFVKLGLHDEMFSFKVVDVPILGDLA